MNFLHLTKHIADNLDHKNSAILKFFIHFANHTF